MTDELVGKTIGGYEITGVIGRGGMATVYRAHQKSMQRTVALKVLPRHFLNNEDYLQRFHREVKIVSQLEHRNIVPVHDYGEQDEQPFIAMRYMSGGSVDDLLKDGPMPLDAIIRILEQIAPALDYAHGKTVLHRDLKPSNVLMDDDGGAYLTDFGIARILSETGGTITTHGVVGTPSYMSPEQAQGQPLDGRSDVYSLGVMLFEMATGRRPFESDTPYGIAVLQVTTPPPSPRSLNPNLPPAVENVILTALKKRREDRYPSAASLVDALKQAVREPALKLSDTQPGIPKPDLSPPPGFTPAPPMQQVQPVYTPPPPAPSRPMTSAASAAVPRVRRKKGSGNLFLSALIGVVIGCGLLTLVVLAVLVIMENTRREEERLLQTATADALLTITLTADEGEGFIPPGTTAQPDDADTPDGTATELPLSTATPRPTSIPGVPTASLPPDAAPSATPFPGVEPVGVRATPTPPPVAIDASGAVLFFAERGASYNLYRMDLPDLTETQLTDDPLSDSYPLVSPDGEWIVFQSDRDGDFDIYVMESSGINTRRVVQNRVTDRIPAWSPDGEWILFSSDTRGDGNYDLFRVHPDGSELQLVYSNGQRNSHARWSPDNRYIVFTTGRYDDANTWEIARYDVSTGEVVYLTDNNIKDWSPTFSADGSTVLYLTQGQGFGAIGEMDINGENARIVYDGAGYESAASYSPDGQHIIFTTDADGHDELYIMDANGDNIQPLTTRGGHYGTWFP